MPQTPTRPSDVQHALSVNMNVPLGTLGTPTDGVADDPNVDDMPTPGINDGGNLMASPDLASSTALSFLDAPAAVNVIVEKC